jgi:hypothetical protein
MREDGSLAEAPFSFTSTKTGLVQIYYRGRLAKVLRERVAARFLLKVESADAGAVQLPMAKATGQFKLGNERLAEEKVKR